MSQPGVLTVWYGGTAHEVPIEIDHVHRGSVMFHVVTRAQIAEGTWMSPSQTGTCAEVAVRRRPPHDDKRRDPPLPEHP